MVAQSVAPSTRINCGYCHFDGGGGTSLKHGDMDNSLYNPTEKIDFHMGGLGFQCTDCHTTSEHQIAGGSHGSMAESGELISYENCHDADPHKKDFSIRITTRFPAKPVTFLPMQEMNQQ